MAALFLILLATIMAVFGVVGYQRGAKAGFLMTALVWAGLAALSVAFDAVAMIVNGLNYGIRFILAGGVQALGGSGDKTAALNQVTLDMGVVRPLMTTEKPGIGVVLVLGVLLILALLLGLLKAFKQKPSLGGLTLGLFNGYIVTANVMAALTPEMALLPTPFKIGTAAETARVTTAPVGNGQNLSDQIGNFAAQIAGSSILPVALIILIALMVILANRQGKGSSRG